MLRRLLPLLALAFLVVGVASASGAVLAPSGAADDPPPPPPVEPPPDSDPPGDPSTLVPAGVTIAGLDVGGLTADDARALVEAAFAEPLAFSHGRRRWSATPEQLGAKAYVDGAIGKAFAAVPGSAIDLVVAVRGNVVRAYVAGLDETYSRAAVDSRVRLVNLAPRITKPRDGFSVRRSAMTAAIVRALRTGVRGPLELEGTVLRPRLTPSSFGPVVVIRRESKRLFLYNGQRLKRQFRVATGQASYPTPLGRFQVEVKWKNPWWYPPPSPWAQDDKPVPPGPGNPLGTRWMGLSAQYVGIHGTPDSASIGYSASHGCIRMLIRDAEWLFEHVGIGTPVFIVKA